MTIEVKHRFGGHGGIAVGGTEWELTTEDPHLRAMIKKLPTNLWPVQHSHQEHAEDEDQRYCSHIILPQGLDEGLVGRVIIAFEDGDIDNLPGLLRECQEVWKDKKRIKDAPTPKTLDAHTEHCCLDHKRCKYGEEETCTVAGLGMKPSHPCNCDWM